MSSLPAPAAPAAPLEHPLPMRRLSAACRSGCDLVWDALGVISTLGEMPVKPTALDACMKVWRQAWRSDRGEYLVSLDFALDSACDWVLVGVGAPNRRLPPALAADRSLRTAFGDWVARRLGREETLVLRSSEFPQRGEGVMALTRALATQDFHVSYQPLTAPSDGRGTVILDSYLPCLTGRIDIELPSDLQRLAFPLWGAALDDPTLITVLRELYPSDPLLAAPAIGGWGAVRTFVSATRALGAVHLPRGAAAGDLAPIAPLLWRSSE